MKKKRGYKILGWTAIFILIGWLNLTLWVEADGPKNSWTFGETTSATPGILIVYDPDPFYNLDEQVCRSFGQAMADSGLYGKVATVSAARELKDKNFNVYVFCANTYNWRPDWSVTDFIEKDIALRGKPVIAMTLGSGSTEWSQANLEKIIAEQGGDLVDSKSLWLLRPNDESRLADSNAQVAQSMVYSWAAWIAHDLRIFFPK